MPKIINHQERKEFIMETARRLFEEGGIKNANFSNISQKCKISRTTLYQYFHDDSALFSYSVEHYTRNFYEKYSDSKKFNTLESIVEDIINTADQNEALVTNLITSLEYLDNDVHGTIHRRTAKLRLLLSRIIRENKRNGIYKMCNAEDVVEKIFVCIESYCFDFTYMGKKEAEHMKTLLMDYIASLKVSVN